jgi:uncharacterized protein (DUF2235 family)/membrane protease YdiL (CAAX protease family)
VDKKEPEGRNIVICLDGTGNEIGSNLSNVLKLYRMTVKDEKQLVYYDPGVGTVGKPGWWSGAKQITEQVLGLALGLGLDSNVLDAYSWLCRTWQEGDRVYLFGFSRGAYSARVLAGFIHLCGLLHPEQLNLCGYAMVAYKQSGDRGNMEIGRNFRRLSGARRILIHFIGCWDTVSSVIVPRPDRLFIPSRQTLPYTRRNPSVRTFRHAVSMDERRRMFRLNHWEDPQPFRRSPFERDQEEDQDIRQVWFAGMHSDVGGGYPEPQSGLSKYPLLWMIAQAQAAELRLDQRLVRLFGDGGTTRGRAGKTYTYVAPDPAAEMHKSLTGPWWLLEPIPQRTKEKEWPRRRSFLGFYIPWAEPRPIPNRPWEGVPSNDPFFIHSSVLARIKARSDYRPVNLPAAYEVDTTGGPPDTVPPPPFEPERLGARLKRLFGTVPASADWRLLGREALVLVPVLAILGFLGNFLDAGPGVGSGFPLLALVALAFVLFDETLFRGILMKPPPGGASAIGPAALSAALFVLWHPLLVLACALASGGKCTSRWAWLGTDPWFLAALFGLGLVCARVTLASRSIWPAVALHWLVATAWLAA